MTQGLLKRDAEGSHIRENISNGYKAQILMQSVEELKGFVLNMPIQKHNKNYF